MIKKLIVISLLILSGGLSQSSDYSVAAPIGWVLAFIGGALLSTWFEERDK